MKAEKIYNIAQTFKDKEIDLSDIRLSVQFKGDNSETRRFSPNKIVFDMNEIILEIDANVDELIKGLK